MKSRRLTEEQIIGTLKQAQAGMKIVDLCLAVTMTSATCDGTIPTGHHNCHYESDGVQVT